MPSTRSVGAEIRFPVVKHDGIDIRVFTTRPDTLFGATYMVLAPEHPLVDAIVAPSFTRCPAAWRGLFGTDVTPPEAVAKYRPDLVIVSADENGIVDAMKDL